MSRLATLHPHDSRAHRRPRLHRRRRSAVLLLAFASALLLALPAPASAQRLTKAAQFYEDALARYEKHDVAGAIVQLKNALQQDPNLLAGYILLGKAELVRGDAAAAEGAFTRALELGVDRSEIAMPMARSLLEQGKLEALIERFPAASVPERARPELLVLRGRAFQGRGDYKEAAAALEEARAIDPRYAPALLAHADLLGEQGKREEATKLVDRALAIAPDDANVWSLKGSLAHTAGDVQGALQAYAKAVSLNPRLTDPRIGRASLLLDLGRASEAEGDVDELRKVADRDPRAQYLRAAHLANRGDSAGAREALQGVTRLVDPVPRDVMRRRTPLLLLIGGLAHHGLGQLEKARAYLEDYLRVEPRHWGARRLLGSILLSQGEQRAAISVLEPLVKDVPNDSQALAMLASAYMARRQFDTAASYLERALAASGSSPEILSALGFSLLGSGQSDLGIQHLERAFRKDPGQARAGMALTILHLKRDRPHQALEIAETVARRDPRNVLAQNVLGIARAAVGDRPGADAAYRQALQLDRTFLPAQINLGRLEVAEGKHAQARDRFAEILKARPNNARVIYELALAEDAAGRTDEAIRWLEKARALDRRSPTAAVRLVDVYIRRQEADKALEVAKDADAAAPSNIGVLAALTRAHLALGDAKSAQAVLSRMTRLAGFDWGLQTEIAAYQIRAENPAGAALSLDRALSGKPDYLPALALQTGFDLRQGAVDKAEGRAKAIITRHPQRAIGYQLLADAAVAKGRLPEAILNYQTALAKEESTEGALRLFQAHVQSGNAGKGTEFLESWVRARPKDIAAMTALAEGYLRAGNLASARSSYERVLKEKGEDPYLLNNLANILARQGDRAALDYAERAYRFAPKDPAVQDTLGWLLVERGQPDLGLRHLREARLRDPQNPEIRYHLAAALARVGRQDEARRELEPALQANASFEQVEEARTLLRQLSVAK